MKYAIKKSGTLFWRTGLSAEQICTEFADEHDAKEWLVCPLGEAGDRIAMHEFLKNPDCFRRLADERRQQLAAKSPMPGALDTESSMLRELRAIHGWVIFIGIVVIVQITIGLAAWFVRLMN